MPNKLKPLFNNLLIKRATAESVSKGGIILAESAQRRPHRGTVLAAGPGRHFDGTFVATECVPGDIVIFPEGMGHDVSVDGEILLMLSEDAVIAVVVPE
jgi:chaperonin GroES